MAEQEYNDSRMEDCLENYIMLRFECLKSMFEILDDPEQDPKVKDIAAYVGSTLVEYIYEDLENLIDGLEDAIGKRIMVIGTPRMKGYWWGMKKFKGIRFEEPLQKDEAFTPPQNLIKQE